jgi:hypothetical protein
MVVDRLRVTRQRTENRVQKSSYGFRHFSPDGGDRFRMFHAVNNLQLFNCVFIYGLAFDFESGYAPVHEILSRSRRVDFGFQRFIRRSEPSGPQSPRCCHQAFVFPKGVREKGAQRDNEVHSHQKGRALSPSPVAEPVGAAERKVAVRHGFEP